MKKIAKVLFLVSIFLLPLYAEASLLDDFVNWIVPNHLKVEPTPEAAQKGVGGVLIMADPVIISGDTAHSYYIPSLATRSFVIENKGQIDLYLNRSSLLRYSSNPTHILGDLPNAYALNVGFERRISISNPSTTTGYFLSKSDLGILSTSTPTAQSVFLSDVVAQASRVEEGTKSIASFTFSFVINNATNQDIYINRLINFSRFITFTPIVGASTTVKFIESKERGVAGDTASSFVIPAGQKRPFEVTGIIDNSRGVSGAKTLRVSALEYSYSSKLTPIQYLQTPFDLRGLSVVVSGLDAPVSGTPSPGSPTSTPVSSGSPVTNSGKSNEGFIAATLTAVGNLIDSLFSR